MQCGGFSRTRIGNHWTGTALLWRDLVLEQTELIWTSCWWTWRLLKHSSGVFKVYVLWLVEPQVAMSVRFELGRPKPILFLGDWHSRETDLNSWEEESHWPTTSPHLFWQDLNSVSPNKLSQYFILRTQGDVVYIWTRLRSFTLFLSLRLLTLATPCSNECITILFFQPRITCWKRLEWVQFGWWKLSFTHILNDNRKIDKRNLQYHQPLWRLWCNMMTVPLFRLCSNFRQHRPSLPRD